MSNGSAHLNGKYGSWATNHDQGSSFAGHGVESVHELTLPYFEGSETALQDVWPNATCYGCGPANHQGLRIKSYWSEDESEVVCDFQPRPEYNAGFPNVMYGGLVASLIDCHSIWTAIAWTYRDEGREHGSLPSISYVTGTLTVRFLQPTELDKPAHLRAHVTELHPRRALVTCSFYSGDVQTAEGQVVAVRFSLDKSVGADTGHVQQR